MQCNLGSKRVAVLAAKTPAGNFREQLPGIARAMVAGGFGLDQPG